MSILVQKGGLVTTIQDSGRTGFRRFGINPNGAMDKTAARLINLLLGNDEQEAVLETHFPAPVFLFEKAAVIALGGADFGAKIDDKLIENWRPFLVEKNQILSFGEKIFGNRAYLSVRGGFKIEKWLGSASTNLAANVGGFEGRSLQKGDKLFFKAEKQAPDGVLKNEKFNYKISKSLIPPYSALPTARVIAGAEFESLTALGEQNFLNQNFAIKPESDRMGFRLQGEPIYLLDKKEIVSSATDFGTIQLMPDEQMTILMADHQTSGGYPRIAHIISTDLPLAAQLGAGDKINFKLVSIQKAEDSLFEFEKDLNLLKIGVNFRYAFD
jgi:antagonist of KipI